MARRHTLKPRQILAAMAERCRLIPDVCRIEYPMPNEIVESPTAVFRMGRYSRVNPGELANVDGQRWTMDVLCRIYVLAQGDTPSEMGRVDSLIPQFVDAFDNSLYGAVSQLFPSLGLAAGDIEGIDGPQVLGDLRTMETGQPAYATDLVWTVTFTRDGEMTI